jgi:hypothetical protein
VAHDGLHAGEPALGRVVEHESPAPPELARAAPPTEVLAAPSRTDADDPERGRAVDRSLAARALGTASTISAMNERAQGGRDCHAARKAWSVVAIAEAIVAG